MTRQAPCLQCGSNRLQLPVGADDYRDFTEIANGTLGLQARHLRGDEVRLFLFTVSAVQHWRRPAGVRGAQRDVQGQTGADGVGHGDDLRRRAEVLTERGDVRLRKVAQEVLEDAVVRPTPGEQTLRRIADEEKVAVLRRQLAHQRVLGRAGVLSFIDQDGAVATRYRRSTGG